MVSDTCVSVMRSRNVVSIVSVIGAVSLQSNASFLDAMNLISLGIIGFLSLESAKLFESVVDLLKFRAVLI